MEVLIIQTLALLLVAYFVGCAAGCMIRRLFFPSSLRRLETVTVAPAAGAVAGAASVERFERALSGEAAASTAAPT